MVDIPLNEATTHTATDELPTEIIEEEEKI